MIRLLALFSFAVMAAAQSPLASPGFPPCSVCGEGFEISIADGIVEIEGDSTVTCAEFQRGGQNGFIEPRFCSATVALTENCGCVPVVSAPPPRGYPFELDDVFGKAVVVMVNNLGSEGFMQTVNPQVIGVADYPESTYFLLPAIYYDTDPQPYRFIHIWTVGQDGRFYAVCQSGGTTGQNLELVFIEEYGLQGDECVYTAEETYGLGSPHKFPTTGWFVLRSSLYGHLISIDPLGNGHIGGGVETASEALQFSFAQQKDAVVDLGVLQQYIETKSMVNLKIDGRFLRLNRQPKFIWMEDSRDELTQWFIERKSLLSNKIRLRNARITDRYACIRTHDGREFVSTYRSTDLDNVEIEVCEFEVIYGPSESFALRGANSNYLQVQRRNAQPVGERDLLRATGAFTYDAAIFEVELSETFKAQYEILSVDFPFFPSHAYWKPEIASFTFSNNGEAQQTMVNLAISKMVETETTVVAPFAADEVLYFQPQLNDDHEGEYDSLYYYDDYLRMDTSMARMRFSGDTRTSRIQRRIETNHNSNFSFIGCTKTTLTLSVDISAFPLPFVAKVRKLNVDGTVEVIQAIGHYSGIVSKRTVLGATTEPMESYLCVDGDLV